jgi:hypothetical protein
MKIIHTFVKTKNGTPLNEYNLYCMLLSVLLAKKHYVRVELYCDRETYNVVKEIGIPYTDFHVDELDGLNVGTFSIPKLKVYSIQNEPYLHIDLDTFLFEKPKDLDKKTVWGSFPEGSGEYVGFEKNNKNFFTTYMVNAFKIQDNLPEDFLKHVKFKDIMNMSIFGGYNFELISQASKYCLEIYENNKEYFDSDYYNACIIEQLFIPSAIRYIVNDKIYPRKTDKELFSFFYTKNPTLLHFEGDKFGYPFVIESNDQELLIKNKVDLFRNISYNFNGFLHLNGYKDIQDIIFMIKQRTIQEFSATNQIIKIDNMFNDFGNCNEITKSYKKYLVDQLDNLDTIENKTIRIL